MNVSATYKCAQRTGEAPLADAWRNASKEGGSVSNQPGKERCRGTCERVHVILSMSYQHLEGKPPAASTAHATQ
jgi:hypothetical protein